jgi:hypothetical protein
VPRRRPLRRRALAVLALGAGVLVASLTGATSVAADSGDVAYDVGLQWNLHQIRAEEAW